uniref:VWFD domain-containing protein n=1 Tax=Sinocyclocheilus rhinocerous TaxID=307959 RepID=A0A673K3U4_9TELE
FVVVRSGNIAVVKTNFGLQVTFDWSNVVSVTLPNNYSGAVCGLCGNFNGVAQDDLAMHNGMMAPNASSLGQSWQVAATPGCSSAGCVGAGCSTCTATQRENAQRYCEIITNRTGPFRECHAQIDPRSYLEDCIFDTCHFQGHQVVLCDAVAAYASACQSQNVTVHPWRNLTFMHLADTYPKRLQGTHLINSCFLLGIEPMILAFGQTCVPQAECGCFYRGRYYNKHQMFYAHEQCLERCVCGRNGTVSCQKSSCAPGEACRVVDGVLGCHPVSYGRCVATGDPHYFSFDGRFFDFQGTWVYTLAKVCDRAEGQLVNFSVDTQNEQIGNRRVSGIKNLTVTVYNLTISIRRGEHWRVIVNNEFVTLPSSFGHQVTINRVGQSVRVQTDFGLRVLYDASYHAEVHVPSNYQGHMCGLCGNYNGNPADDFLLPNGTQSTSVNAFGQAWALPATGVQSGGASSPQQCDQTKAESYRRGDACGLMAAVTGPFSACHDRVNPEQHVINCVFDMCVMDGDGAMLCENLQAYAIICQQAGIQIMPWRNSSFCLVDCPANSHYAQCSNNCANTCASLSGSVNNCPDICMEGCQCDEGWLSDGDACVPVGDCGCVHNGKYLKVGEVLVTDTCNMKCVCRATGLLECVSQTCARGEICEVRDGQRDCYTDQVYRCPENSHYEFCGSACPLTCMGLGSPVNCTLPCVETCACDPGFVLSGSECIPSAQCGCSYNGHYIPAGETFWADDACQRLCRCSMEGGHLECQDGGCGTRRHCQVENGIRDCYPVSQSTCMALGDPHYYTFDGNHLNFQGNCVYQLVGLNVSDPGLVPFDVLVQNDFRGSKVVSFTKLLEIRVYNTTIVIDREYSGSVTVSSSCVLNGSLVQAYKDGGNYVIKTGFGLKVTYDLSYYVTVTIPGNYRCKTCGLCGNFDGDPSNDFRLPDGNVTQDVNIFRRAWKVHVPGVVCEDGCEGDACLDCNPRLKAVFEKPPYCRVLVDPNGPFAACHTVVNSSAYLNDCVFDACASDGNSKVVCDSVARYAFSCHTAGVGIQNWRTDSFCPMSCLPNSHYEACASPCPATCPYPNQQLNCTDTCVEACACDSGFVLGAGTCVPTNQCGCFYKGAYYQLGQTFWADEKCHQLCKCDQSLAVVCHESSCAPDESCLVINGIRGCHAMSSAVCVAAGDPHYSTFDGLHFDFQGTCVNQLAALCIDKDGLVPFNVTIQNHHRWSSAVSFTKMVNVTVNGFTITLTSEHPYQLLVSTLAELPLLMQDVFVVVRSGNIAVLKTNFGLQVTFDWSNVVRVTLRDNYSGAVCGLCGNFNGVAQDDLAMHNGMMAPNASSLGQSWQVAATPGCSSAGCVGAGCSTCTNAQRYCEIITNRAGPFRECHTQIDPRSYLEDCIFDPCHFQGHQVVLCDAVAAYASACQSQNVTVHPWRNATFCPPSCPPNSHYNPCAPGCTETCVNLSVHNCSRPCAEACQCDQGYILSGQTCVPQAECGCFYRGRYYNKHQMFYTHEQCLERCVCGRNGTVSCQKSSCAPGEACRVVDGVLGCHPVSYGRCVATGDPHYFSFDGRIFDFQGTCVYTLAKVFDQGKGWLVNFSVDSKNEQIGNRGVSLVETLTVTVYNLTISIKRGERWRVIVSLRLRLFFFFCFV